MQARSELSGWRLWLARRLFLWARVPAIVFAWLMVKVGLHKQIANRLLEPWVWHTAIVTATEWENFFKLRLHPDAQPEFQELARQMSVAIDASTPQSLAWGEWHLPYTNGHDLDLRWPCDEFDRKAGIPGRAHQSVARCARVSYVRQDAWKSLYDDHELSKRLSSSGHWSPFEHIAQAETGPSGNFRGFKQLRKFYPGESGVVDKTGAKK